MKKSILILSIFLAISTVLKSQEKIKSTEVTTETAPVMTFNKTTHDYGTIKRQSDGKALFLLTNTGKEPLILSKPRSSCGCTVPEWPQEPIMPGQSDTITLTYETKKVGNINKQVTIISNAINSPIVLRITGKVEE